MGESAMRKIHVVITGTVQGVGYRAWCERAALTRQIVGWVRNRADGSVEAMFCGDDDEIEDMLATCHRGPAAAAVSEVKVNRYEGEAPGVFMVLPTA
jgi:acylphosphatase